MDIAISGYPIVLNVAGRRITIVGGGNVALRKLRGLIGSGASCVTVIATRFHPEMPMSGVRRIEAEYRPELLDSSQLVFAATDSAEVNERVVRDAREIGALACRADVDENAAAAANGDFVTPAIHRDGPILLAVSSGGSPALSARIRDRLAGAIDPAYKQLAAVICAMRPKLRRAIADPRRRRLAMLATCSDEALDLLKTNGQAALEARLIGQFPELQETFAT